MLPLPPGAKRVVTFPSVTGRVNPIMDYEDWNGPAGDGVGGTTVESFGGISGIVHAANGMFLVGVFLGDGRPATPEPSRLDFTNGMPADPTGTRTGPDLPYRGREGAQIPGTARSDTTVLGFADGYLYQGPPGWYDNNAGELEVTVDITVG
jgi:hypothetical protein